MTANQYRAALEHLGLTQTAAAELLGVHRVTATRWAANGVSGAAAILLHLLLARKISLRDLQAISDT